MSSNEYLFILVNGTWAGKSGRPPFPFFKPAEYMTEKRHILKTILKEKIQEKNPDAKITFLNGWWHSKNNVQCRKDGAVKIANEIREYLVRYGGQLPNIFLIAHSHGCDVCYRIMQEKDLSNKINGLIAMNSPNMIELKRDFFTNIKARKFWLKLSLMLICLVYTFLLVVSMVKYYNENSSYHTFEANVNQHLIHIVLIILLIVSTILIITWLENFINFIKKTPSDFKFEDTDHKVLCTNSSGDEAWNVLNLFSSISQFPFFLTHPYIQLAFSGILVLFFIVYSFFDPDYTSYLLNAIPVFGPLFQSVSDVVSEKTIILKLLISAVFILCTVAIFSFLNLILGYLLSLAYETIGIGNSFNFRNLKMLISRRTIVSMLPAHIRNIQFLEISENTSKTDLMVKSYKVNHSRPYNDEWTIERMAKWITSGKANLSASPKSNTESDKHG